MPAEQPAMRVLRVLEYHYKDYQRAAEDMMRWDTPANGVKRFGDMVVIRSAVMGSEFRYLDEAGVEAQLELEQIKQRLIEFGYEPRTAKSGVMDLIGQVQAWKDMYEEVKQGINGAAPDYVYKIIDALFGYYSDEPLSPPLDFEGTIVPPEIQGYLASKGFAVQGKLQKQIDAAFGRAPTNLSHEEPE